jgi:hypothetical protein
MKYIKLFEDYTLDEGRIPIYPPGNPYKMEKGIRWIDVIKAIQEMMNEKQAFTVVCDFDYDKYSMNPDTRSKVQGNEDQKDLPLFTKKYPQYGEAEFDVEEVKDVKLGDPALLLIDKKGMKFLVEPARVIEIQKGSSVRDGIFSGDKYWLGNMLGKVIDYKDGVIKVHKQDGKTEDFTLADWKKGNFMHVDEKKEEGAGNDEEIQ